ncbi:MAG: aldolase/citrate lyase family protein [Bacteroidales bacterium]|jgi:citrate lyase subunit beta/citryl-CoA lyase|nr:aldolase/citrate lyase family protein [Bacteroidales bacterium]
MSNKIATAGNTGKKIRSDCFVTLELKDKGGIQIEQKSKVEVLYGKANIELCNEVLKFYGIENALLTLEDKGAIPLIIAARIEAAVKQLIDTDKEYFLEFIEENKYFSEKEQFRFSRLYLPGNSPSMMLNAGIHEPNGIILDLEDSVAFDRKKEAQLVVRNTLRGINFYGAERMVRINQFPKGLEDLKYLVPHNVHMLLVPKCEGADQIKELEEKIEEIKKLHNIKRPVLLMPIIESALGVEKAFEIASVSENVVALAIGLEDYTADLGTKRTNEAVESFYARTRIVNACKAARIQAIDSVFSDVGDMDALRENVKASKGLGFEGMGCIHPRQIKVIHESFAPEPDEIEKAKKVVNAFIDATERGLGVVSLGTKMIDPPVVKRAETTINLAISLGLISENWREEFLNNE